jgi:hypothetical protein
VGVYKVLFLKDAITAANKHIKCHAGLDKPAPYLIRGHLGQLWIPASAGMTALTYIIAAVIINCEGLRLRAEENHTYSAYAHDNACEIALKLPTAKRPSGARSGQFEMHGCLLPLRILKNKGLTKIIICCRLVSRQPHYLFQTYSLLQIFVSIDLVAGDLNCSA